jgi:hypothetical protein
MFILRGGVSCGKVSACGVMGRAIEFHRSVGGSFSKKKQMYEIKRKRIRVEICP